MKRYIYSSTELTQADIEATNQDPKLVRELYDQGYIDFERSRSWGLPPRVAIIDSINTAAIKSSDPKLLRLIIDKFNAPRTLLLIAKNPNTPLDILQMLVDMCGSEIRGVVAKNPNADYSLVSYLAQDDSRFVRSNAESRLSEM